MAKLNAERQSLTKQNQGVWIEWRGMKFKVARFGNDLAKKMIAEEAARNRERKERKEPERNWEEFWLELLVKAILVDWADVERDDGSPWVHTQEEAAKVLSNPEFQDLKDAIQRQASTRENFLESADKEVEKN